MIDERHEELATLYALDLIDGEERSAFERALSADEQLQRLVVELRDSASALARMAAVTPPDSLRERVMANLGQPESSEVRAGRQPRPNATVIRFRSVVPWAMAAGLAIVAAWQAQRLATLSGELELARTNAELAEVGRRSFQTQLDAERIVLRRESADLNQKLAAADAELVTLARRMREEGAVANLKITALASMLNNSPQAHAVAVWDPNRQEGVLTVEKLPALAPSQDYQLWVVDPQYPNPVDGGVFTVDPQTGEARLIFKARQPVAAVNAFAVTLERKGGVPKAEGPFVLLGK
jgi:anti-sigma-K factor RskA